MTLPIIWLPGLMCDHRLFAPQLAAFGGEVGDLTQDDSIAAMAARVLQNAPDRFALAGLSMGGIVAMDVVRQAPERVERLALLDTNERADKPVTRANRAAQVARARDGMLDAVMQDELKPLYVAQGPRTSATLDICLAMARSLGVTVFERQQAALASRPDQSDTLAGYHGRALVLCGAEDALCPPVTHERIASLLPASQLVIIDGAGHLPTLETPERCNAALSDWLGRTG